MQKKFNFYNAVISTHFNSVSQALWMSDTVANLCPRSFLLRYGNRQKSAEPQLDNKADDKGPLCLHVRGIHQPQWLYAISHYPTARWRCTLTVVSLNCFRWPSSNILHWSSYRAHNADKSWLLRYAINWTFAVDFCCRTGLQGSHKHTSWKMQLLEHWCCCRLETCSNWSETKTTPNADKSWHLRYTINWTFAVHFCCRTGLQGSHKHTSCNATSRTLTLLSTWNLFQLIKNKVSYFDCQNEWRYRWQIGELKV